MGSWGPGNIENDDARDYLGDIIDELLGSISTRLVFEQQEPLDIDCIRGEIMPRLDILLLLDVQYGAYIPLEAHTVTEWQERVLSTYDDEMDGVGADPDFVVERRKVIEATFDKLASHIRKYPFHPLDDEGTKHK